MSRRLDTQVPSEGAESLVQGMLCREGVPTFKAPAFRAAYDLVAVNPNTKKSATIQVKSRFQTDCDRGFVVSKLSADFFAFVFLNMGNWYGGKPSVDRRHPEFYIVPRDEVERVVDIRKKVPRFFIKEGDTKFTEFRNAWHLVADSIGIDIETLIRGDSAP
jgi:hypothetical protein